eukprot:68808_1
MVFKLILGAETFYTLVIDIEAGNAEDFEGEIERNIVGMLQLLNRYMLNVLLPVSDKEYEISCRQKNFIHHRNVFHKSDKFRKRFFLQSDPFTIALFDFSSG